MLINSLKDLVISSEWGKAPVPLESLSDELRQRVDQLVHGSVSINQFSISDNDGKEKRYITASSATGSMGEPIM